MAKSKPRLFEKNSSNGRLIFKMRPQMDKGEEQREEREEEEKTKVTMLQEMWRRSKGENLFMISLKVL